MRIAIVGAGLAGTACAYIFKNHGFDVAIFEASDSLAAAASGNDWGLFNPRLSATVTPESTYFATAFRDSLSVFDQFKDINSERFGSIHLMDNDRRKNQFGKCQKNWGWDTGEMRFLDADEASDIAGIALKHKAIFLPEAGALSPVKLCAAYAEDVPVFMNRCVRDLEALEADIVILAAGTGTLKFSEAKDLPLRCIRGQVSKFTASAESSKLKTALCYGGYSTPARGGVHIVGATFEPWSDHAEIHAQDDVWNLKMLNAVAPEITDGMEVVGQRASVRVGMKDRFPAVGRVSDRVFASVGHGSHGIISSLMAARLLVQMVEGREVDCLPDATVRALNPLRFAV